jgi:hypothetical protein
LWVGLAGLLGLKPLIEGYRDAVGSKPFPNQMLNNEIMLLVTRGVEVSLEAVPQSIIQTILLMMTTSEDRTFLQYISLIASFLTTAITVAFADKAIDASNYRRKDDPFLFGYVASKTEGTKQLIAAIAFITTYAFAKTFSFSILFC